jgi:hypothetical protein
MAMPSDCAFVKQMSYSGPPNRPREGWIGVRGMLPALWRLSVYAPYLHAITASVIFSLALVSQISSPLTHHPTKEAASRGPWRDEYKKLAAGVMCGTAEEEVAAQNRGHLSQSQQLHWVGVQLCAVLCLLKTAAPGGTWTQKSQRQVSGQSAKDRSSGSLQRHARK